MFDLEKSIADWRGQMLAAGIKTPVPLEELESHLREEIERQTKSGLSEAEAFNSAVQKIGQVSLLKTEFKKAGCSGISMKATRTIIIIAIAHSALWWASFAILKMSGFNLFDSIHNSSVVNKVFDLNQVLSVPLVFDSFYALTKHLPMFLFVALNGAIWGGVLGGLWIAARQKFNRRAVIRN
jgi:hypothetical protein